MTKINKIKWEAVFFDFDGVILDSVHIKTRAFAEMFRSYGPEIEKQVVDYHLANGGISRFQKFRYYYENWLHKPVTEKIITELDENFSEIVLQEVLEAPFIEGACETLKDLYIKNVPMFVVSGTPQEEIKHIVQMRSLSKYFKEVQGSPRKKTEIIRSIKMRYQFDSSKCLLIGDAMTDYDAALATGTLFLGIVKKGEISPFPYDTETSPFVTIKHFFNG